MSDMLLNQFSQLNHQDKYDKVMVYLHAAQKSEENLIGIYAIVDDLWVDGIDDTMLIELYTAFLDLVEYSNQEKLDEAAKHLRYIEQFKQKEAKERSSEIDSAENLINSI